MGSDGKTGAMVTALQSKKGNFLVILHQENLWICDTGASTHMTWIAIDAQ